MTHLKTRLLGFGAWILPILLVIGAHVSLYGQPINIMHSFAGNSDGGNPAGSMLLLSDTFFGCANAGSNNTGVIYSIGTNGSNFTILHTFGPQFAGGTFSQYSNADGILPQGHLVHSMGRLFGLTQTGGTNGAGVLFSIGTDGSAFSLLRVFDLTRVSGVPTNSDGANPSGGLLLSGGTMYGTMSSGGPGGSGTLFSIDTNGSNFSVLRAFSSAKASPASGSPTNADGAGPQNDLVLAGDTLFGVCAGGGTNGRGTIFSVNTNGSNFSVLHHFAIGKGINIPSLTNADGTVINGGLLLHSNVLYGTASEGGLRGYGTLFSIGADGSDFKVLRTFSSGPGGISFTRSDLTMAGEMLLGTQYHFGTGTGEIFSLGTNGSNFWVTHVFTGTDGVYPNGGLINVGNVLYGTASGGGAGTSNTIFNFTIPSLATAITQNPDLTMTLNFAGAPFNNYLVQSTTNVTPPTFWQTLSTNTAGADGTWQFTDTNAPLVPSQFYRGVAQ